MPARHGCRLPTTMSYPDPLPHPDAKPAPDAVAIDGNGDVVMGTEVIISKRYGYDSEDNEMVAAMVEAYNAARAKVQP
jgi:hypothetical protein